MAFLAPEYADWLPPESIPSLSRGLSDSPSAAERRTRAFRAFTDLPLEPNPLYRKYGYAAGVDLRGIDPALHGPEVPVVLASDSSILIVHDAHGSRARMPPSLDGTGVSLTTYPPGDSSAGITAPPLPKEERPPVDRLAALSGALVNRGYTLDIPADLASPIQVHDVSVLSLPHEALSVHRQVRVGERSLLAVTEEVYSTGEAPGHQRWYSSGINLDVEPHAQVVYVGVHAPDSQVVSFYGREARVAERGRMSWTMAGFGGFRTRIRNASRLTGAGADIEDLQTFFGDGDQSYDSAVDLTHIATDTHGQSITRGLFKDRARGMSRGLVRIEKEARRTLSYLSEHAMLLSRGARSDTIPILEILNRDVKATHSSSVAPVDPEKVFYLESRGFTEKNAVRTIGEGFLAHVLERSPVEGLRETLYPLLSRRWEGVPVPFGGLGNSPMPDLTISGAAGVTDWRFDSKLR